MNVETYQLKITFITPVLGSQPSKSIATSYLAERNGFAIPEDAVESLPDALDQMTTVFHRQGPEGKLVLFDYHLKGFLKEAGRVLNGQVTGKVKALRSKVDNLVFVSPRMIVLNLPDGGEIDTLERSLRAETAQGPRTCIARSEMLPEETWFTCGLSVLPGPINEEVLRELLDYGFFKGLGQWRNGRWGSFRYELVKEA